MPYQIQNTTEGLILRLSGGVTIRHAAELSKCLASSLTSGVTVVVQTQELEDIDTSILQLLVSLRKTTPAFVLETPSEGFVNAVDRCALRGELLAPSKDDL
jgi:ABC-type transporter Mla MlaB component